MTEDDLIRRLLLGVLVVVGAVGIYHRWRAATGERLDRWQEGWVILFGLRLTGLVFALVAIAWWVRLGGLEWSRLPLPSAGRWVGLALTIAGGLLAIWTFRSLGRNLTDTVVTRRTHALVTTGPYRWVRHPFYVSGLLLAVGFSLAMANGLLLVIAVIGIGLLVARTPLEEARLVARFGDDYRRYMHEVGRFVPRWRR